MLHFKELCLNFTVIRFVAISKVDNEFKPADFAGFFYLSVIAKQIFSKMNLMIKVLNGLKSEFLIIIMVVV